MEETANLPLPDAFLEFLRANGIDPSIYAAADSIPRYVRLEAGCEAELEEIEAEIKCQLQRVEWLPGFYSLPPHIQIASSNAYKQGKIYGIDAASGAAVMALDISAGDHVLDLCAAPGAKLCMMLELIADEGSVTGVDVARHRLAACRTMVQKYKLGDRCRLFVADGTSFSLIPLRSSSQFRSCDSDLEGKEERFREWTSRRPWKERKRAARALEHAASQLATKFDSPELIFYGPNSGIVGLKKSELYQTLSSSEFSSCGYDKVLVDAECTHDGSIKHVQKFEHWGWETLNKRVLNAERTDDLTLLQNEDVVQKFLEDNESAELKEIDPAKDWPCRSGRISKTLRFDPVTSQTSGLFVAKFTKLAT
ncbi:hypothetical protein Tsubulata_037259 [Turnera subulata]|uniref:SAM-dependent MTase RsmB/NOP-type domain-containing protein n=1 Tax=Turnera subulata TaxID=218843 RepID=A0A9Q0GEW4_9ROSI|nr:hypothetical protein Tsubulata_037259 [Turnera subulata]